MASPKVEQIAPGIDVGEGPHWDHNAKALYYVDIRGSTVNKYDPATKKHTTVKIGMYIYIEDSQTKLTKRKIKFYKSYQI